MLSPFGAGAPPVRGPGAYNLPREIRELAGAGILSYVSQQDLEGLRDVYDAFARGDRSAALELSDPDIEITERPGVLDSKTYRGHEGLLEAIDNWVGQWDEFRMEIEQMTDAGGGRVVSVVRHYGRGKLSGVVVEQQIVYVHTLRNGKVIRWQMFGALDEALAAIGQQDHEGHADTFP
jgi:ketosteroid isomerase-like protein